MRGRPPVPTEIKIATGNPGHRPLPMPVVGAGKVLDIPIPEDLTAHERKVWMETVPPISRLGWVDQTDIPMLRMYVYHLSMAELLFSEIRNLALTQRTVMGETMLPQYKAAQSFSLSALRIASEYGLTPSARARLGLTVVAGMSLAQELQNRLETTDEISSEIEVEAFEDEDSNI